MKTSSVTLPDPNAKKNTSYYIMSVIGVVIVFGFGYLPPIDPISPLGMRVLGIFIGMLFLWSLVDILWPSLLGILALGLSGYAPVREIFKMSFGDSSAIMVLFVMVLFGAIQDAGVTRYLSRWFLTRKLIDGRPVIFTFVFMYTTYIISALSASALPILLLMWAILYSVLNELGYKKGDPYTAVIVIGTMLGAISGQAAKPFTSSALVMVSAYEKVSQTQMDYLPYMAFGVVMATLVIVGYCLMVKFIFRPDMSLLKNISSDHFKKDKLPPMDLQQKILMFCLFAFITVVLLPSFVSKKIALIGIINSLTPAGVTIAFIVVLSVIKIGKHPIINFKQVASRHVLWDIYCLVCVSMALASALTAESSGVLGFLINYLRPLFDGKSLFMFTLIFMLTGVALTQFCNNVVVAIMLLPIGQALAAEYDCNYTAIATLLIFAVHIAIITPAASPYAATLFGNKDWVSQKEIMKYGSAILIMGMLVYSLFGIPIVNFIFN